MSVTLIIILHNRHENIKRLIAYYKNCNVQIILADSSTEKHTANALPPHWKHIYTPGITYTQKIETVLQYVKTQYVILCADDDFIIPSAIEPCAHFLNTHLSYAATQGLCVCFKKNEVQLQRPIQFYPIYTQLDYAYENNHPLNRIDHLLSNYKSLLYAMHRTDILKKAYQGASSSIKNLYLNEYNASILSLALGKYKELPFLYQVREYAEDSDDKTAANINTILKNEDYINDLNAFLNYLTQKIIGYYSILKVGAVGEQLFSGLKKLAKKIEDAENRPPTFKKRIGSIIQHLPILGNKIISKSRKIDLEKQMHRIVNTPADQNELNNVKKILSQFR